MTLIPDFGQVQSDAQVLNLSPFEVRFDERRAFFLDGTELFNKSNIFYSRRVGGRPEKFFDIFDTYEDEERYEIVSNPQQTQLINAVKISGRGNNGLGLGFFNAVTAKSQAEIFDKDKNETIFEETTPLTNFNVMVLDKSLKRNGNFSLMNTNVIRNGNFRDANVSRASYSTQTKDGTYEIGMQFINSLRRNIDNDADATIEQGHSYGFEISKIKGNFNFDVGHYVESEDYNINDLGFLFNNNESTIYGRISYNINKPTDKFNSSYNTIGYNYNRLFEPSVFTGYNFFGNHFITLKNFTTFGLFYNIEPVERYDYFEPRVEDYFYTRKPGNYANAFISPDYRKKFVIDFNAGIGKRNYYGETTRNWQIRPIIRFSDNLRVQASYEKIYDNEIGYLDVIDDLPYLSKRKVVTRISRIDGSYIFTSRIALDLVVRHYNRSVNPYIYYALEKDGSISESQIPQEDYNNVINFFNLDMVFKWEFAPGSEARLVWKSAIVHSHENVNYNYQKNLKDTFFVNNNNNVSLKVVYFLDWLNIKKQG